MRNSCRRCRSVQVSKLYLANIYAVYALIRGNPGGGNPGDIRRHGAGLVNFVR